MHGKRFELLWIYGVVVAASGSAYGAAYFAHQNMDHPSVMCWGASLAWVAWAAYWSASARGGDFWRRWPWSLLLVAGMWQGALLGNLHGDPSFHFKDATAIGALMLTAFLTAAALFWSVSRLFRRRLDQPEAKPSSSSGRWLGWLSAVMVTAAACWSLPGDSQGIDAEFDDMITMVVAACPCMLLLLFCLRSPLVKDKTGLEAALGCFLYGMSLTVAEYPLVCAAEGSWDPEFAFSMIMLLNLSQCGVATIGAMLLRRLGYRIARLPPRQSKKKPGRLSNSYDEKFWNQLS